MLKKITIKVKLLAAFIAIAVIAGVIGLVGYRGMSNIMTAQDELASVRLPSVVALQEMNKEMISVAVGERGLINRRMMDEDVRKAQYDFIDTAHFHLQKAWAIYEPLPQSEEEALKWKEFVPEFQMWLKLSQKVVELSKRKDSLMNLGLQAEDFRIKALDDSVFKAFTTARPQFLKVETLLDNLVKINLDIADQLDITSDNNAQSARNLLFIFLIIGVIFAVLMGYVLATYIQSINHSIIKTVGKLIQSAVKGELANRGNPNDINFEFAGIITQINELLDALVKPLNVTTEYVNAIAKGDIPEKIKDQYYGDFDIIKTSLNTLIDSFNEIVEKAKLVAEGDLSVELKMRSENDELIGALTNMVKSVSEIVQQVKVSAEGIADAGAEMSSNAQQVSQGATEQASAAEEVSSSMEEMSSNIQQNTENSQQTEKISLGAAQEMEKVREASMQSLKSIKEIANKITIIGDIAFQTNILALNAAVEAARAGEHGRGFAVVAAEVRKLAERSKIAAEEINILSQSSVEATERSEKQIQIIIPDVEKTARLLQEITAASMEQSSGASQINNAISQLNQITQQNAAAAEEMATSSEELSAQADKLKELVSFFKIENEKTKKTSFVNKSTQHAKVEYKSTRTQHANENNKGTVIDLKHRDNDPRFDHY